MRVGMLFMIRCGHNDHNIGFIKLKGSNKREMGMICNRCISKARFIIGSIIQPPLLVAWMDERVSERVIHLPALLSNSDLSRSRSAPSEEWSLTTLMAGQN